LKIPIQQPRAADRLERTIKLF